MSNSHLDDEFEEAIQDLKKEMNQLKALNKDLTDSLIRADIENKQLKDAAINEVIGLTEKYELDIGLLGEDKQELIDGLLEAADWINDLNCREAEKYKSIATKHK